MSSVTPIELAYAVAEPADGQDATLAPIIFLHTLIGSREHWGVIPSTVANKTKRKVYVIEFRNHGETAWSEEFNIDINVADLFHFMDTHNISKAVLVGHVFGGCTAIRAALEKPERVEKLIVESMYVKKVPQAFLDNVSFSMSQAQQLLENLPNNLDEAQVQRRILDEALKSMPEKMAKELKRGAHNNTMVLKQKPDGKYAFKANISVIIREMRNGTLMSDAEGSYSGPACFIYGELSHFRVKEEEDHIKQFFPQAKFICMKGASHTAHFEFPTEFADAVSQYILQH